MSRPRQAIPPADRIGLSRVEAAEYIGVSSTTFDAMVADGRMPHPKEIGSRRVWHRRYCFSLARGARRGQARASARARRRADLRAVEDAQAQAGDDDNSDRSVAARSNRRGENKGLDGAARED